jgi:hypothetical protein
MRVVILTASPWFSSCNPVSFQFRISCQVYSTLCRRWRLMITMKLFQKSGKITLRMPWDLLAGRSQTMTYGSMRCLPRSFRLPEDLGPVSGQVVQDASQALSTQEHPIVGWGLHCHVYGLLSQLANIIMWLTPSRLIKTQPQCTLVLYVQGTNFPSSALGMLSPSSGFHSRTNRPRVELGEEQWEGLHLVVTNWMMMGRMICTIKQTLTLLALVHIRCYCLQFPIPSQFTFTYFRVNLAYYFRVRWHACYVIVQGTKVLADLQATGPWHFSVPISIQSSRWRLKL